MEVSRPSGLSLGFDFGSRSGHLEGLNQLRLVYEVLGFRSVKVCQYCDLE